MFMHWFRWFRRTPQKREVGIEEIGRYLRQQEQDAAVAILISKGIKPKDIKPAEALSFRSSGNSDAAMLADPTPNLRKFGR
ncbi:MAG: hypothetical protein ABSF85_00800 [Terriglobales bacterium]|jgi:hypothetical protein